MHAFLRTRILRHRQRDERSLIIVVQGPLALGLPLRERHCMQGDLELEHSCSRVTIRGRVVHRVISKRAISTRIKI